MPKLTAWYRYWQQNAKPSRRHAADEPPSADARALVAELSGLEGAKHVGHNVLRKQPRG